MSKKKKPQVQKQPAVLKYRTMLKFKLTEEFDELEAVGEQCRKLRNVAIEDWMFRLRGKRETKVQAKKNAEGKGLTEDTKLYHAIEAVRPVPITCTAISSDIGRRIASSLNTRLAWQRRGSLKTNETYTDKEGQEKEAPPRRKDAIAAYMDRPPFFTDVSIPLKNRATHVHYGNEVIVTCAVLRGNKPYASPLRSQFKVSLRKVNEARKKFLRSFAGNRQKNFEMVELPDSTLVKKDKGWYWYLSVERKRKPVEFTAVATLKPVVTCYEEQEPYDGYYGLPKEVGTHKVDVLNEETGKTSKKEKSKPCEFRKVGKKGEGNLFGLEIPGLNRPWWVGNGRWLKRHTERLVGLRKIVGWSYHHGEGHSHGRQKIDKATAMRYRQLGNMRLQVRRQLIRDIVRMCVRNDIGTLVMYVPSEPAKDCLWFNDNGLDWDWTTFTVDLANSLHAAGIRYVAKKLNYGHLRKPKARQEEPDDDDMDEDLYGGGPDGSCDEGLDLEDHEAFADELVRRASEDLQTA